MLNLQLKQDTEIAKRNEHKTFRSLKLKVKLKKHFVIDYKALNPPLQLPFKIYQLLNLKLPHKANKVASKCNKCNHILDKSKRNQSQMPKIKKSINVRDKFKKQINVTVLNSFTLNRENSNKQCKHPLRIESHGNSSGENKTCINQTYYFSLVLKKENNVKKQVTLYHKHKAKVKTKRVNSKERNAETKKLEVNYQKAL